MIVSASLGCHAGVTFGGGRQGAAPPWGNERPWSFRDPRSVGKQLCRIRAERRDGHRAVDRGADKPSAP